MLENYTIDAAGGVMVPSYVGGTVDPAGAGACWANPGALAHADRFQSRELTVLKMPYPLGGHTYQTVRFHHVTNQSVLDSVYDLDSGVLLLSSSVVLSSDGRHTQLTQMTYLGRRQLELPAADLPAPDWLGAVRQLRYQGAVTVQMAGMPQFPMPMSLSLQKTGGGARWARYEVSRQTQGQLPGSMELIDRALAHGVDALSASVRDLDVALLHKLLIEGIMGLTGDMAATGVNVLFSRDGHDAANRVARGEAAMVLYVNTTRVQQVMSVAVSGQRMPQKGTYFYPKPLAGLALHDLRPDVPFR